MNSSKHIIRNVIHQDIDASLKFICPECNNIHWLFLREIQIKNFKIVCECGCVLIPKQLKTLKPVYTNTKHKQPKSLVQSTNEDIDIRTKCGTILRSYGYSDTEIQEMLDVAVSKVNSKDIKEIIKYCVTFLGVKYV